MEREGENWKARREMRRNRKEKKGEERGEGLEGVKS